VGGHAAALSKQESSKPPAIKSISGPRPTRTEVAVMVYRYRLPDR